MNLEEFAPGVWGRPDSTSDRPVWEEVCADPHHLPLDGLELRSIIDLGCNAGYTTRDLALRYPEAKVLGVDIDSASCQVARLNTLGLWPRVRIWAVAIWHTAGVTLDYAGFQPNVYSAAHTYPPVDKARSVTISGLAAAEHVAEFDFVKMDVEGAEQGLLLRINDWRASVRTLRLDVHDFAGVTLEWATQVLEDAGYTVAPQSPWNLWAVRR